MASTYTLNNGIELIGTGEQSGTWGDTTNTNFELVDTALDGQVSILLSGAGSSGSPTNLPVSDGSASNGRNRMITFTDGTDLGATAYVQLTPNDSEKIIYVRNDLRGSRSIILFQGTYNASNDYEVPAGTTAVVYFDGAGSGAVAANVFNNAYFDSLRLGGVSVTAILDEDNMASNSATALSTQQSIKAYVDAQVGAFDSLAEVLAVGNTTGGTDLAVSTGDDITFADNSKAIFGAGSDLQIYHDGSHSIITDVGTGNLYLRSNGNGILLQATTNEDSIVALANGAVTLYHDNASKLATTSTGIDVTGTILADGLSVGSTSEAAGLFTGYSSITDVNSVNNGEIRLGSNNGYNGRISYEGQTVGVLYIENSYNSDLADIVFRSKSAGTAQNKLLIEGNGDISFYEDTGTTPKFFWDASAERLGLGTVAPNTALHVSTPTTTKSVVETTGSSSDALIEFTRGQGSGNTWSVGLDQSNASALSFAYLANGSPSLTSHNKMTLDASGNVGIGTDDPDSFLHLQKSDATAYSSTATDGQVGVGPTIYLENPANSNATVGGQIVFGMRSTENQARIGATGGTAPALTFGTADAERMRITSEGYVGINYNNPSILGTLVVVQKASARGIAIVDSTVTNTLFLENNTSQCDIRSNDAVPIVFSPNSTEAMRIDASGNVGIGIVPETDWFSTITALQIDSGTSLSCNGAPGGRLALTQNARQTANNYNTGWNYISTDEAAQYIQVNGTHLWRNAASGTKDTAITWSESMRIDSNGAVGLGTVPAARLHVKVTGTNNVTGVLIEGTDSGSSSAPDLALYRNSASPADGDVVGALWFYGKNSADEQTAYGSILGYSDDVTNATEDGSLRFFTARSGAATREAMRLDSSGVVFNDDDYNVDFRVESANNPHTMFIQGSSSETFFGTSVQADTAARVHVAALTVGIEIGRTTDFYGLWFARNGAQKGFTQTTSSGTTYNQGSDARLKENVSTITDGIDVLNQMRAVEFDWIGEEDAPRTRGFIAQEMLDVAPEAVAEHEDPDLMMGMDYGRVTPVIVAALQEALAKINDLEARLTALEG